MGCKRNSYETAHSTPQRWIIDISAAIMQAYQQSPWCGHGRRRLVIEGGRCNYRLSFSLRHPLVFCPIPNLSMHAKPRGGTWLS